MLAVHLEGGAVFVRDVPPPVRPAGHALLRLLCGGICNTDLELQRGYYGFRGTPGHEFVAEVVEAADPGLIGRRVVGEINLACGACEWCRKSLGRHCPNRSVLGIVRHPGAFQELFTLPECNLHVIPDSVPDEVAVFTEPVAAACEVLDQVTLPPCSLIAVLGDGKLGLLIAQVLNAYGHRVDLFGHHPEKLRLAEERGVRTAIADNRLPAAEYEWVVESTGSPEGLPAAVSMTRPRGTLVLKSTVHGTVGIDTAPVVVNEITIVGSRCGRFEEALPLLDHELIRLREMVTARFPLRDAPRAFERAAEPGALKVLLTNG